MPDTLDVNTTPSATRERTYDGDYMAAGNKAEKTVMAWLRKRPWVVGVDDLRALRVMREADVDCSITLADGRVTLAEIKSDRHLNNLATEDKNFLFEVLRINHTAPAERAVTLGWSARTPALRILYFSPEDMRLHCIATEEFRRALQDYTKEARKLTKISYVPTDCIKSTVNILIPKRFVIAMPSYRAYNINEAN
jgi:hypothetical protein